VGENRLFISPLAGDELELCLLRGEKSPYRGWCCLKYGQLTPSWSLSYFREGTEGRFVTHIGLNPSNSPSLTAFWQGESLLLTEKGNKWRLAVKEPFPLRLNGQPLPIVKIRSIGDILAGPSTVAVKNGGSFT